MSMGRQVCRMGAVLAVLLATLAGQPSVAVAGKRSLCGVTVAKETVTLPDRALLLHTGRATSRDKVTYVQLR